MYIANVGSNPFNDEEGYEFLFDDEKKLLKFIKFCVIEQGIGVDIYFKNNKEV